MSLVDGIRDHNRDDRGRGLFPFSLRLLWSSAAFSECTLEQKLPDSANGRPNRSAWDAGAHAAHALGAGGDLRAVGWTTILTDSPGWDSAGRGHTASASASRQPSALPAP